MCFHNGGVFSIFLLYIYLVSYKFKSPIMRKMNETLYGAFESQYPLIRSDSVLISILLQPTVKRSKKIR